MEKSRPDHDSNRGLFAFRDGGVSRLIWSRLGIAEMVERPPGKRNVRHRDFSILTF